MATLDRTVLDTWDVNDASDMVAAIEGAEEIVALEDGYLSFLYMTKGDANVSTVRLIKVDLGDSSFAYELELGA
jgi:hypothetical protein